MDSKQGIHVMTLANSIIGVSILAMPYCFKQCGIVLSIILLIFSSILSRLACHFLLKSAIKARLRTFEFLAYHIFGSLGKLFVEIGMIGFLIGTCIAFFVVMGDLGPQIVAHMTDTESSDTLRTTILVALAIFCVLPLGLLKNVDSLSGVCTATIGFYGCLVLKIMGESASHILVGDWVDTVNYWRPAGILQCIPIFSMALFCQTQLFEIYQAIPNASLEKMNNLVRLAVNICTCVYIFVGIFGYIAISHEVNFTGNILMNFKPSIMTEVMKIGFVLSVAFSFPLVIFPCRASLYSLIYKPTYSALHESTSFYIPEGKFKILTFLIVLVSLIIGVLIPNIELVLGLVGSTIGVMICVLFPATCFICLTSKNTNERILAQIMLFIGIIMMVLGTYANLYAMEQVSHGVVTEKPAVIVEISFKESEQKISMTTVNNLIQKAIESPNKEIRHEPPQPEAPPDEALTIKETKINPVPELQNEPPKPETVKREEIPSVQLNPIDLNTSKKPPPVQEKPAKSDDLIEPVVKDPQISKEKPKVLHPKTDEIDKEAIKKEDNELEQVKLDFNDQKKLYEEQHQLIAEHKKILDEMKLSQEKSQKDREEMKNEKLKAVKNIEILARLAIESLVDDKSKMEKQLNQSIGLNPDQNLLNHGNKVLKNLAPIPLALASNINKQKQNTDKPVTVSQFVNSYKTQPVINTEKNIVEEESKQIGQVNNKQKNNISVLSLLKGDGIQEIAKSKNTKNPPNSTIQTPLGERAVNASKDGNKNAESQVVVNMKINETKSNPSTKKENLVVAASAQNEKHENVELKNSPEIVKKEELKTNDMNKNEDKIAGNHRDILSADNYLRRKRDIETNRTEQVVSHIDLEHKKNFVENLEKRGEIEEKRVTDEGEHLLNNIQDGYNNNKGNNHKKTASEDNMENGHMNNIKEKDRNIQTNEILNGTIAISTDDLQKKVKLEDENNHKQTLSENVHEEHCQKDDRSDDLFPNKSTDLITPKNLPKALANEV